MCPSDLKMKFGAIDKQSITRVKFNIEYIEFKSNKNQVGKIGL